MTTKDATESLLKYFKQTGNLKYAEAGKWGVLKKYKNYLGLTCRDFYNEQDDVKMLVVQKPEANETDEEQFDIIPNENFLYYIKNNSIRPLYVYAPYLSNKGLTFKFALYSHIEQKSVTLGSEAVRQKLFQKLYELFVKGAERDKNFPVERKVTFLIEDEMFFITNYATNEIVEILELNNFKFDDRIFKYYQNGFYENLYPDILDVKYQFPEDAGKNSDQSMNTLFNVVSISNFTEETYTRARNLLRKMTLDDLRVARKISMDLNLNENAKIKELFQMEIKRRKVNNFVFN